MALPIFAVAFLINAAGVIQGSSFVGATRIDMEHCLVGAARVILADTSPQNPLPEGDSVLVVCTDPNTNTAAEVVLHPEQKQTAWRPNANQ